MEKIQATYGITEVQKDTSHSTAVVTAAAEHTAKEPATEDNSIQRDPSMQADIANVIDLTTVGNQQALSATNPIYTGTDVHVLANEIREPANHTGEPSVTPEVIQLSVE